MKTDATETNTDRARARRRERACGGVWVAGSQKYNCVAYNAIHRMCSKSFWRKSGRHVAGRSRSRRSGLAGCAWIVTAAKASLALLAAVGIEPLPSSLVSLQQQWQQAGRNMTQFLLFESASVSEHQLGAAHLAQTPRWSMHIAGRPRTGPRHGSPEFRSAKQPLDGDTCNMHPPATRDGEAEAGCRQATLAATAPLACSQPVACGMLQQVAAWRDWDGSLLWMQPAAVAR